jgi:hypothetical protein
MITAFLAIVIFAASAENVVVTITGFIVSALGTQIFKNTIGLQGAWSVLLAVVVSVVVAVIGIFVASFLGGDGFSWDALVKQSGQIFVLATLAYHVIQDSSN